MTNSSLKNFIHTGIYHLDVSAIDFEVAHLYEHLLIATFKQLVESKGFSRYLFGWIGGETFKNVMFIEYGVYNPAVDKLLRQFLNNPQRIDFSLITSELARVQTEVRSTLTTYDGKKVRQQLQTIDTLPFQNHEIAFVSIYDSQLTTLSSELIPMQKASHRFRDITVEYFIENPTLVQRLVMLRLRPLLTDIINAAVFSIAGYDREVSLAYNHVSDAMALMMIFTIPRHGIRNEQIETLIKTELSRASKNLPSHKREIELYYDGFETTPNWHSFAIDYYRYTGVLTTRREIKQVSTIETMIGVIQQLKICVTPTVIADWETVRTTS